jgi:hypothetical protein
MSRAIDMKKLRPFADARQHRRMVQEGFARCRGVLPSEATMSWNSLTA